MNKLNMIFLLAAMGCGIYASQDLAMSTDTAASRLNAIKSFQNTFPDCKAKLLTVSSNNQEKKVIIIFDDNSYASVFQKDNPVLYEACLGCVQTKNS